MLPLFGVAGEFGVPGALSTEAGCGELTSIEADGSTTGVDDSLSPLIINTNDWWAQSAREREINYFIAVNY